MKKALNLSIENTAKSLAHVLKKHDDKKKTNN